MVNNNIEEAVFSLIEKYNAPSIFSFRRFKLQHNTDLNNDFRMDPLDAYDLLEKYIIEFNINPLEINFEYYFPDFGDPEAPLTIQLLIDSAKAGHWLGK